ncbi:MAG: DNRLRE domain-containing protein [Actinobacteria bacterium]|nr:DNRLRE domain-containing protein [Actinomycetota bacterium]
MTVVALDSIGDAYVSSGSPDSNYGTATSLTTYRLSGAVTMRALFRFDLTSIPAGATVNSARLLLTCSGVPQAGAGDLDVRALAADFAELGVTWANQPATSGIISPPLSAPSTIGEQRLFDVASHVATALGGILPVQLRFSDEAGGVTGINWASREHATPSYRPALTVDYSIASGPAVSVAVLASKTRRH